MTRPPQGPATTIRLAVAVGAILHGVGVTSFGIAADPHHPTPIGGL